jgi:hypothetical protein
MERGIEARPSRSHAAAMSRMRSWMNTTGTQHAPATR